MIAMNTMATVMATNIAPANNSPAMKLTTAPITQNTPMIRMNAIGSSPEEKASPTKATTARLRKPRPARTIF